MRLSTLRDDPSSLGLRNTALLASEPQALAAASHILSEEPLPLLAPNGTGPPDPRRIPKGACLAAVAHDIDLDLLLERLLWNDLSGVDDPRLPAVAGLDRSILLLGELLLTDLTVSAEALLICQWLGDRSRRLSCLTGELTTERLGEVLRCVIAEELLAVDELLTEVTEGARDLAAGGILGNGGRLTFGLTSIKVAFDRASFKVALPLASVKVAPDRVAPDDELGVHAAPDDELGVYRVFSLLFRKRGPAYLVIVRR